MYNLIFLQFLGHLKSNYSHFTYSYVCELRLFPKYFQDSLRVSCQVAPGARMALWALLLPRSLLDSTSAPPAVHAGERPRPAAATLSRAERTLLVLLMSGLSGKHFRFLSSAPHRIQTGTERASLGHTSKHGHVA